MSIVRESPPGGLPPLSAIPGRPKRRNWRRSAVLVALSAAVASYILLAVLYSPIEEGNYGHSPHGIAIDNVETYGRPELAIIHLRSNTEIAYFFSITNRSPWGVTISDVPVEDDNLIKGIAVYTYKIEGECCPETQFKPFHPFALHPGETWMIMVRGTFARCDGLPYLDRYGIAVRESQIIGFRFLGVHRQIDFHLPQRLVFLGPTKKDCSAH